MNYAFGHGLLVALKDQQPATSDQQQAALYKIDSSALVGPYFIEV